MKATHDTDFSKGSTTEQRDLGMDRAVRFISEAISEWRNGAAPDANAILAEHPHLHRYRSLVLDLAAEEYKCRRATGESISADEFAVRFPGMEKSLYFLLEVQRMIQQDSALGTSQEAISWPKPDDKFLSFSLLTELGQGTFGRVYLASDTSLGNRLVALKVAPQGQWEAELLGKLGHPNIVPVYSIQKEPKTGLTAICMPFLGRITLQDVIEHAFVDQRRPIRGRFFGEILKELNDYDAFPPQGIFDILLTRGSYLDAVVHLAIQMADALSFTHEQGIYHRDLKPSNILLSDNGHPLILDFNLSSHQEFSPSRVGGTLPYMAPEQLRCLLSDGSPVPIPELARSDLFSLGVILYELSSGALPFGLPNMKGDWDDVALDLLARQKRGPRPLQETNPDVDERLAALIEGCLAFEPQHRPSSAKLFADSLRSQQSLYRRTSRWSRRHPLILACSGISLLLCGLLFGIWLALRDPYPIRLYREGILNLQQGKPADAIARFNEALLVSPDNKEFLLERGKAYCRQGKYSQAFTDYQQVYALDPTGEVAALRGYCLCRLKYYQEAIECYEQAKAANYRTISLFNNLGYCNMQLMQLNESEANLRKAISLNPRCATSWNNLIILNMNRFRKNEISLPVAREIIKNAIKADEPTSDLFINIAILESLMAKHDPLIVPNVFEHLKKAISFGADPRRIAHEYEFEHLRDRKEFSELLQQPRGTPPLQVTDGLITPF